jgi:hypothetical protein
MTTFCHDCGRQLPERELVVLYYLDGDSEPLPECFCRVCTEECLESGLYTSVRSPYEYLGV